VRRLAQIKKTILGDREITKERRIFLISLSNGFKESYSDWLEFLGNTVNRGLRDPLSVATD